MQRNMIRLTTVGAALGVAALLTPAVATAAPGTAQCTKVATTLDPGEWSVPFGDEKGQEGAITATTVVDDDGSLEFTTGPEKNREVLYHPAGNVKLADAITKPLTFEKSEGQANWQIRLRHADNPADDGFTTLVWTAPQRAGEVNPADATDWWSTRQLGDLPRGERTTLTELVAKAGPNAVVEHYGISSENSGKVNVDNVSFNGCTTNFAATGAAGAFGSLENLIP